MTESSPPPGSGDAHPILVPREIVNTDSVYVVSWTVEDGTLVEAGAAVCEVETSKAVEALEAECTGYVRHGAAVGEEVPIGGVLGYITARADTPLPAETKSQTRDAGGEESLQLSAKARRKIEELGLDISRFAGRGFVRERDVLEAAREAQAEPRSDPRGPFRLEPLGPIQRRVARVMEQSVAAMPAAYLERTIDLAPPRQRARLLAGESKTVVTEVDLLVVAVARACEQLPRFNSFVTPAYEVQIFENVNVGVAVDVDGDLYVVTVKNATAKSPVEIAKELRGLQYMATRRRLHVEQLSGGTITVTSMIGRGVHRFQPIPYPHQAAIVGISDTEPDSTRASLTLGFDHRVANGTQAAAFLNSIDTNLRGEQS